MAIVNLEKRILRMREHKLQPLNHLMTGLGSPYTSHGKTAVYPEVTVIVPNRVKVTGGTERSRSRLPWLQLVPKGQR